MTFNTTKCEVIRSTWKAITMGKRLADDIQYHKVRGHTFYLESYNYGKEAG